MSRLDDLPPDQRATLSVLLGQRRSYAQVAAMLGISEDAVHDRAHAALAVLAPALARGLGPDERTAIGDYLLDQPGGGVADRLQTRRLLADSQPARAWAQALADELAPLGETAAIPPPAQPAGVPDAPATAAAGSAASTASAGSGASEAGAGGPPTFQPPAPPPSARPQVSRAGGAILLGLLAAAVIIGILFATGVLGGGSGKHAKTAGGSKTSTGPTVDARLTLRPPNGSTSSAGLVQILSEGEKRAFYVVAEGLQPTHGFFYALWLYNSPSSSAPLGKAPPVGSNKRLEGGGLLPTNAGQFKEILLTRETNTRASKPGPVVLRGRFRTGG